MAAARCTGEDDMLPREAREHLCDLVTELAGVAKTLRAEINTVGDEDMYVAVAMWVDRIAQDLGAMECRQYPRAAAEVQ
jgi:hypothetical protein